MLRKVKQPVATTTVGRSRPTRRRTRLFRGALISVLSLATSAVARPSDAGSVTPLGDAVVQVVNGLTQQPVRGALVVAKQHIGDSFKWQAQQSTDNAGQVRFRLPGLGTGQSYAFFAQPYNGGWAQSSDVATTGTFRFLVGMLPVTAVAGGTGAVLANTTVTIKEHLADGTLQWVKQGTTGNDGIVTFDVPGLGAGRSYVLEAKSPWDGTTKRSNDITDVGPVTFVVGNAPLTVTLVDALSLQALPYQRITVRERLADGSLKWTAQRDTDDRGQAVFDLPGLGQGRTYVLSASVFNGTTAVSSDLTAAGPFVFKVGTLAVQVVRGGTGEILPAVKVTAYEQIANASPKWVLQATTDERGLLRLDLAGIDQGRRYLLQANSPWDGTSKWSNAITSSGHFVFMVGNAPLRVTLLNGLSGQLLSGQKISARERLADGSSRSVIDRTTDTNGLAVFDLQGLGDGRVYFLQARPYNGGTATSPDLTAPGDYQFKVGMLEVAAVKGADLSPLPATLVTAKEVVADGTLKTTTSGTTDANGIIRFDLPGLGAGRNYQLEAKSPIDGTTKRSDVLTATGRYTFTVGNAPLNVALMNALSGDPLPNMKITASERLATGKLQYVSQRVTDAAGRTSFDLTGLGSGRIYVLSVVPYNTGTVYSDDLRAPGQYDFRVGGVEVTAIKTLDNTPIPSLAVSAREKGADGKLTTAASGSTDANGLIRFDLPGLKAGKTYVLEAKSPLDGSTKRSQDISANGKYVFQVGNPPVIVTLRNALSGQPLAGVSIAAREKLTTGTLKWIRQVTTDAAGQAIFDLEGLGTGRTYLFTCTPYNGGSVDSDLVTKPGAFDFLVGTLEVTVVSGATGQILPGADVAAIELYTSSKGRVKERWTNGGTTDAAGIIRFDLPGLGNGRTYVLDTSSPIDGSRKRTAALTQTGKLTFVVGNKPLRVTLTNGLSNAPLPDTDITAYELLPDGDTHWTSQSTTDATGVALFDLDGLGDGRVYVLTTDPYDAGGVDTPPIAATGDVAFRVGTVPVMLVDGDNNVPMAGIEIHAYEKTPDGELRWAKAATTDANGVVQFDFEGVSQTTPDSTVGVRVYVLQLCNPFGVDKTYYSGLIDQEGPFEFRITRDGDYPLDITPPTISISTPVDGGNVDADGFTVTGSAADDVTLSQVVVTVTDPVKGVSKGNASYSGSTQRWTFSVSPTMVTVGQTLTIIARAFDQARNQAAKTISVHAIVDSTPPQVTITSHKDGAEVEKTGFLLAGTATDDIAVASLRISVDDPVLGRTVNQQLVDVTPGNGSWTFTVLNGQVTQGQTIAVTLVAADAKGHSSTASIQLVVVAVDFEGTHLINRITFGATPALFSEVASIGADAFVNQQLAPASIDDSAFDAMLAGRPRPTTASDLQTYELLHAIYSRRQLQEVMTLFWDNHFNTDINKSKVVAYELAENDQFRQNALGSFRTLLGISAKSPAMLVFLDNASSKKANPNENYARELEELHTLGVDGGYTQRDVEQVAKAFTGWQVQNGQFFFNATDHDTTAKVVLGQQLPAGRGIEDGEQVLDILAAHPSTARFICTKLSRLFVSDKPPSTVVDRCASSFLVSGGQMGTVVQTILRSPEFADAANFRAKVKTPLEFVVGVVRNFGAAPDWNDLVNAMGDMGMNLFMDPVPTGWSETGDDWINSNTLIQRFKFVNHVAFASAGNGTSVQLRPFFTNNGFTTADGIVGFLFQMLFHHDFTALDRQVALAILTNNGTDTFDLNAASADARLRRLAGTVMTYPGYQFQ